MIPPHWTLYVDESGDFDDLLKPVAVAALLVKSGLGAEQVFRQAKSTLEAQLPEVPWPPHATVLRWPLAWCAWARQTPASALGAAARQVDDTLEVRWPEAWPKARRELGRGHYPAAADGVGLATFAAHAVCSAPQAWATLAKRSDAARDLMGQTFSAATAALQLQANDVYCVLAAEAVTPIAAAATQQDRYLALLAAAVARGADAAVHHDGTDVEVHLHVLGRRIRDGQGGTKHMTGDDLVSLCRHLDPTARLLTNGAGIPSAGRRARIGGCQVHRFDSQIPVALAYADWLANSVYRAARPGSGQLLAELQDSLTQRTVPSWAVGQPPLPTIAAGDPAHSWLQACRTGHAVPPATAMARWAGEQALLWQPVVTK